MLERVPRRWRLALRILEATAMRIGELAAQELRDASETVGEEAVGASLGGRGSS
jgi:integrase